MKQSTKQLFSILTICLLAGQTVFASPSSVAGIHPRMRKLSQQGILDLSIDGAGFFAYALRVKEPGTDGAADESMLADASYDGAYSTGVPGPANSAANSGQQADGALSDKCLYTEPTATDAATCLDSDGGAGAAGNADACTVDAIAATGPGVAAGAAGVICPVTGAATPCTRAEIDAQAAACVAGDSGHTAVGAENTADETGYYIQMVYSRDGSLHVNRYGFLVDDNGLLLMGASGPTTATASSDVKDQEGIADSDLTTVAKESIHVPSRAEDVIVTNTGKVVVKEQGTLFMTVGQIKLTRFANPMGLNIRLKMKSRCSSMNEIGFSLGNWCAGSPLDGKPHEYLAESAVSGPGERGNPGDAGMGYIVQ